MKCWPRLRAHGSILVGALMLLASAAPGFAVEESGPQGSLLIVGGGDTPRLVQERFLALAGGAERAKIAVLPMASTKFDEEAVEIVVDFHTLGGDAQIVNLSRNEAVGEEKSSYLEGFTGFWFLGGNQSRLAEILLGTRALAIIERRYREGAVVGGTSAGAAVMTMAMLTGKRKYSEIPAKTDKMLITRGSYEIGRGFGFLPGAIVDQHFLQRARYNRLLSAVLEQPHLIGVGIDEGTAVLVRPDGRWEVLGDSYVKIFDARRARVTAGNGPIIGASNVRMHLLPANSLFEPKTGRAILPEAE